ncbi:MAG TPA: transglycosylase domain-containing protein [Mycobacteriales bacterium]|nr:transglycosylase domain-containing protein [Mycobacteriales bacterium]
MVDTDTRNRTLGQLLGAVLVAGALVAGIALPFVAGVGMAARTVANGFNRQECPLDLATATPAQKTVILASDSRTPITYLFRQNRDIARATEIPAIMRQAIVSIEDRRFYEHHGVDVQGLLRAVVRTTTGDTQGASTLTQQYVKQLQFYGAKTDAAANAAIEQTAGRKLIEARCALEMEKKFSKDQILTGYLNIANFGAGAYGVKTASKIYFNKRPADLSIGQAALLAGLVQSPTRYNPFNNPKAAAARRHEVLSAMVRDGKITVAQGLRADGERLPTKRPASASQSLGCANVSGGADLNLGFFCDYVIDYATTKLHMTEDQIYTGGYKIVTTLDPDIQRKVQASVNNRMGTAPRSVGVMDVVEPSTGAVRAMGVSRQYGTKPNQTTLPLGARAVAGAGSTYKVFTMLAALVEKVPLRAFTLTTPNNSYQPRNCGPNAPEIHNAGRYRDTLDLETATYQSSNTFFEALIDQRFQCDLTGPVNMALGLGLDSFKPLAQRTISEQRISFTLGPDPTSPLEMASAFSTLANNGVHCPATPVIRIVDSLNRAVPVTREPCKRVLSPEIAHTATRVLEKDTSVDAGGATASGAYIPGYATAGKTGTAQDNSAMWFIGFTPNLSASVAVFNPSAPSKWVDDVPGREGAHLYGGGIAVPIWRDAMGSIMQRYQAVSWPPEDPLVVNGDSAPLPSVIGMDLATAVATLRAAGYSATVGAPVDSNVPKDYVAEQSPHDRGVRGQEVVLYPSTGQPKPQPLPTVPEPPLPPGGGGPGGGPGGGGPGGGVPTYPTWPPFFPP